MGRFSNQSTLSLHSQGYICTVTLEIRKGEETIKLSAVTKAASKKCSAQESKRKIVVQLYKLQSIHSFAEEKKKAEHITGKHQVITLIRLLTALTPLLLQLFRPFSTTQPEDTFKKK